MNTKELFEKNLWLAAYLAQQWLPSIPPQWHEDAIEEAKLGLWKACITYNPEKGAAFNTYASKVINNHLNKFHRANKREFQNVSLQQPIDPDKTKTFEEILGYDFDFEPDMPDTQDIRGLNQGFTIIYLTLQGITQKAIAKKLGTSQSAVCRQLKLERQRLKALLEVRGCYRKSSGIIHG